MSNRSLEILEMIAAKRSAETTMEPGLITLPETFETMPISKLVAWILSVLSLAFIKKFLRIGKFVLSPIARSAIVIASFKLFFKIIHFIPLEADRNRQPA